MVNIRLMRDSDAADVARLHADSITEGFLTKLGRRFLRQMYLGVASDEQSCVYVGMRGESVLGFCAYAKDVSAMYHRVLRSRFWRLGLASLPHSLKPWVIKEVFDTLRYPAKQTEHALPPAEILSISVSESARGTGVGKMLLEAAIQRARQDGQGALKVLAGARLEGANRFYRACGFHKAAELTQHGGILNVYVMQLAEGSGKNEPMPASPSESG